MTETVPCDGLVNDWTKHQTFVLQKEETMTEEEVRESFHNEQTKCE